MLDRGIGLVGIALAIIFGAWNFAPEELKKLPPWAIWVGVIFGVFLIGLAAGMMVSPQQTKDLNPKPICVAATPDIHISLLGANVFIPDSEPNLTGIAIDARVWNTGRPTNITEWKLEILPNGKDPVLAQFTKMPNVITAKGKINSASIRLRDSLADKSLENKIAQTPVEGVILFYVSLPKAVVQNDTTVWRLSIKDLDERETTTSHLLGDWLKR